MSVSQSVSWSVCQTLALVQIDSFYSSVAEDLWQKKRGTGGIKRKEGAHKRKNDLTKRGF